MNRKNLERLDAIAADAEGITVSIRPRRGEALLRVEKGTWGVSVQHNLAGWYYQCHASVSDAIADLARATKLDKLDLESLEVKTHKSPIKAPKVRPIVVKALHEAFGVAVPDDEELAARARARQERRREASSAKRSARGELLAELRAGPSGVRAFNRRKRGEILDLGPYNRLDFAGRDLTDANLAAMSLRGCKFHGAKLCGAALRQADLTNADLSGADLTRANLAGARLAGVDLSAAVLDHAKLERATFDEATVLPAGFDASGANLLWVGAGPDPAAIAALEQRQSQAEPIDLAGFMAALDTSVDKSRMKKALKMLKADRFQLFSDVGLDRVVGVVKSQTDSSLVYAATLDSSGSFACCTQNLNPCGGLRGALCKHILVLVIGLTNSGALDATHVNLWVEKSNLQQPRLDKDAMSEVFLRYKGAEAGEVDWRPTETIPEDYYAF